MRNLPHVTLACIDTANHALALRALALSAANLQFARTVLFTDALPPVLVAPDNVEIVSIPSIRSRDAYSHFVLKDLAACISTSHVLVVQWDGYVTNADAWEDAFLDVDYIGAPWTSIADGMRVGNGGFSLRSRRLLQALTDPAVTLHDAEDVTIGRIYRPWLEQTHGIRFADEAMASRFAFEAAYPIGMPFGFHGLFNFCRTVAPSQLGTLVAQFSDTIIRSQQCRALLRNCLALAQWNPAIAIAGRMLEIESTDGEARNALTKAEAAAARGVGVGRNDPCPCGSGKRYKQCHGATNPGTGTSRPPPVAPQESPDAIVARGMTAHRAQDLADAERNYRQALSRAPDHPYALHYLGVILYQRGRPHEAMPMLDRAVAARPDEPEFHNNRGLALAALQRHAEADDAYRQALERNPGHALAWNNRGLTLQALGNVDAAVVAFRKALELTPDFAQGHWNLALVLLLQGHHAEGFAEYEWRLRVPELAATLPVFAGPRWSGDDPRGKTLLLHAEQGAGDALQMLRFARTLANRGARVIVAVPPPMMRLAATVAGVSTAIAVNTPPPPYDAHISLMSLPHVLGITPIALEATVPYLRPDPQRVHEVRAAIELAAGRAFRIGIAWSGAAGNPNNAMRSLPLAMFAPLLDVPATCWFSLKWDVDAPGPTDASVSTRLAALPQRNDFDGLAALISELDLVITVDTSIAHLAGALGKPVWILLNRIPDWRWMLDREDSPWYPTARLFRQRTSGDWSAPVQEVAEFLRVTLASRQVPR